MKYIERHNSQAVQGMLADDTFEQLQLAFHERLRKDQAGLAVLGTALARATGDPLGALQELRTFAHRLRGAAAIFGAVAIRDAAQDLEIAAHGAPHTLDDPTNDAVWAALALLAGVLTSTTESAAPLSGSMEPLCGLRRS